VQRVLFRRIVAASITSIAFSSVPLAAAPAYRPAKYLSGALPPLPPPTVVNGGEVMLELDVTRLGTVRAVRPLRATPPFTEAFADAVKTWRFEAAEIEQEDQPAAPNEPKVRKVDSTVLVVAMIRPPTLNTPTLGDVPKDVGSEADGTPFPVATEVPMYPPLARDGGIVMIETTVDAGGRATQNKMLQSSPAFDKPSLDALGRWLFRPGRVGGSAAPMLAYVVFVFQQPVTASR